MTHVTTEVVPRWDLSNVFPGLQSPQFEAALRDFEAQLGELETLFDTQLVSTGPETPAHQLAALAGEVIDRLNRLLLVSETVRPYIWSFVSTDSRDTLAAKRLSEFDLAAVRLDKLDTRFKAWVGQLGSVLEAAIPRSDVAQAHAFYLREMAEQSKYLMSPEEEALASELMVSGASAWGKLQGTVTSQLSVDFELDGATQHLPLPALINLHSHPDESVRRRAYEAELAILGSARETLAACMNGVKGAAITLNKRRGREDALHSALDTSRIDRPTLHAMLGAMEDAFPVFRKYMRAKARRLGKEQLPWWDVWAPIAAEAGANAGGGRKIYTWGETRAIIMANFTKFSPVLGDLARRAFEGNWIDAEQRDGKRGGAFCMGIDGVEESRILSNFDGTLDQLSTVAHELGHAFHNECLYAAKKTGLQSQTPMTLAETASIMCETIVMQAALDATTDPAEQLAILETTLIGDTQVIVDIVSRFHFESEVFERRAKSELSADDLCDIMARAQKATYGDGLDERYLHPYMWTWKPHYYYSRLSFYNYPYAFGLLFGTGLYALYKQRGENFVPDYMALLASTGEGRAGDLAARFGIDIREKKFWEDSLAVIGQRVERYCAL
jgi:pepF/M3 family oligoendopeptidase